MDKYCLQIIILNFNKSNSMSFIFNNDHITICTYKYCLLIIILNFNFFKSVYTSFILIPTTL